MSVFTFLCVASLLYMSLADPVPPSDPSNPDPQESETYSAASSGSDPQESAPTDTEETDTAETDTAPTDTAPTYTSNPIDEGPVLTQMQNIANTPDMTGVDSDDADYISSTSYQCMKGCYNYEIYLINLAKNPQSSNPKPSQGITLTMMSPDDGYLAYGGDNSGVEPGTAGEDYCRTN